MDFKLSDEHLAFQSMAAEFGRDKLAPNAAQWDKDAFFPVDTLREAAKLGMAGLVAREDIGGSQLFT